MLTKWKDLPISVLQPRAEVLSFQDLCPFWFFLLGQPVSSKGADDPGDIWTLSCQELQVFHSPLPPLHSPADVDCLEREGKTLWRGMCCPDHHPMFRLSCKEHRQDVVEGLLVIPYCSTAKELSSTFLTEGLVLVHLDYSHLFFIWFI